MTVNTNTFYNSKKIIAFRTGLLHHIIKLPRLNFDPKLISYGIWTCDTLQLNGEKYGGRSSGCSYENFDSFMGTIGETVERYCPAFYNIDSMKRSSFAQKDFNAISPKEFAPFHEQQHEFFEKNNYKMNRFDDDIELYWDKCVDILNGEEIYCPAAFIYLPWTIEDK